MPTLSWIGKTFVQNHHLSVPHRQLVPKPELSLTDKPLSVHDNLIVRGDNLEALKALLPTYGGKVKCIYIDPPYNTGNEGWVYNDNVKAPLIKEWLGNTVGSEGDDLTRHDKWLCMMMPRLKLLRELLREDGVIFVSIDENEIANLRLLMNEVFDESNYISTFGIKLRHEERILKADKDIHEVIEYLVAFKKSDSYKIAKKQLDNTSIEEYIFSVKVNPEINNEIVFGKKVCNIYKTGEYTIEKKESSQKSLKKISIRGSLKEGNSSGRFYMKYIDPIREDLKGCIVSVPNMGNDNTGCRFFLVPENNQRANGDYFQGIPHDIKDIKERPYPNFFNFQEAFNNVGYEGGVDFRFGKKPIEFILKIFEIAGVLDDKNSIILDSFAGSGSTAQAVLQLNAEDQGDRKFVLVEMEKHAESITAQRIKNVINGLPNNKRAELAIGLSGTFSFFELGPAIEMENILQGKNLPSFAEFARYLFFTATGEQWSADTLKNHTPSDAPVLISESTHYHIYIMYQPSVEWLKQSYFTLEQLRALPKATDGKQNLVFAPAKYIDDSTLVRHNTLFQQLPYEIYKLEK